MGGASTDARKTGDGLAVAWAMLVPLALLYLTHPYRGINGDALIYVTREIARDDPGGLARDLMFANDTQTGFTLLSPVLDLFLNRLQPSVASFLVAASALFVWFAGAAVLAFWLARSVSRHLAPTTGRVLVVIMAFVSVWPLAYAAWDVLSTAEPMAVPRPFAEAFALAGLGALIGRRHLVAAACLLLSAAFHPLMALGALAVGFVFLTMEDRRWLMLGCATLVALLIAGWLDAPLARRIFMTLDPEWRAILEKRTAYLFPHLWPPAYWSSTGVSLATLALAARVFEGPVRRLFLAVVVTCLCAVAASYLFGDVLATVLVVQVQPWRALWLASAMAPMAMALLTLRLWPVGAPERLAVLSMAIAWVCRDAPLLAGVAAGGAHYVLAEADGLRDRLSAKWVGGIAGMLVVLALIWLAAPVAELVRAARAAPSGFRLELAYVWALRPLGLPVAALAIVLALSGRRWKIGPTVAALLAVALIAGFNFDDRPEYQKRLDRREPPDGLVAALPSGMEPVLWLGGGKETWYWLGRPNWAAAIQGASLVFSRDLAIAWSGRARALVDAGLEGQSLLQPWTATGGKPPQRPPEPAALAQICARADAPAAIVTPLSEGQFVEQTDGIMPTQVPAFLPQATVGGLGWIRTARVAIHICRAAASTRS